MCKPSDIIASVLIHAILVVAALGAIHYLRERWRSESEPVYFEVLEEVLVSAPEESDPVKPPEHPADPVKPPKSPSAEAPSLDVDTMVPITLLSPQSPPPPQPLPLPLPQPPQPERAAIIAPPEATSRISPAYPRTARRRGLEGTAEVEAAVGVDGRVTAAALAASSGHRELDEAALAAVRTAAFRPATEDGSPIPFRLKIPITFRLNH